MIDNTFVKIKLIDMNDYDEQRILRENINILEQKNTAVLNFVANDGQLPNDVILEFVNQVGDNAAEIMYILSVSDTSNFDLTTYLDQSPLFRGGEVV